RDEEQAAEAVSHGPRARGPARAIRSTDPPGGGSSAGSSARAPYTPPDILLTRGQKGGGRRGEEAAAHGGQGLADQRTAECGALGGSRPEWPGRQGDGTGGSRGSPPSEGRSEANLPSARLRREPQGPTE